MKRDAQLRNPRPAQAAPLRANAGHARATAGRLPVGGLLALATAGFVTVLTEALPAGLLPLMSGDLRVTEALVGQLVTVYALGSLLAAIPLVALTRGMRRRPLLLGALAGFVLANTVTALSTSDPLTLVARFIAGMSAGLLWALLAGYASRMVEPRLRGRAIAFAMLGAPVAMSLGIPLGTALGGAYGWRAAFAAMTALTLALIVWVRARLPDFAGQAADARRPVAAVFALPGVAAVLTVMFAYVLAHNILYTYIAPFATLARLDARVDTVLLVFGAMSIAGIAVTGAWIGARLRGLTLASVALFGAAALLLGVGARLPAAVYVGVAGWGLAFGGAPTLFQTALAEAAGDAADVAQSMLVTVWNLAIAGGGIVGGLVLGARGPVGLPWLPVALLAAAGALTWRARRAAFPLARVSP
jgi:predicted MFS family arabinose efflux permease